MAEADFGDRLKRLIIKKNTKVDAVSLESGVPKRTIDNWTSPSRKTEPKVQDAVAVAMALGTTVEYLVTGESPRDIPSKLKPLVDDLVLLDEEELFPIRSLAQTYAVRHREEKTSEGG